MYAKRGYIPDGSGVWYGNSVCPPYEQCSNDDDLVLYMSKVLRQQNGENGEKRDTQKRIPSGD